MAAIGERSASEPRAWKRGLGVVRDTAARAVAGADVNTDDVLICRAAIDLSSLVRVGDRVPSGVAIPANATFIRLADGVYSPAPSSGDGAGDAVRAFLDALEAKTRKEQMSSETVNLKRCLLVSALDACAIYSKQPRRRRRASFLSMRSTP